jgi:hypothetical protein
MLFRRSRERLSGNSCDSRHSVLKLSDVEHVIPPPPLSTDPITANSIQTYRSSLCEHTIEQVNANLSDFERRWPAGRPVDFFVALRLCDRDLEMTLEKLKEPAFIRLVAVEADALGFGTAKPRVTVSPASNRKGELLQETALEMSGKKRNASKPDAESPPEIDSGPLKLVFVRDGVRFPVGGRPPPI